MTSKVSRTALYVRHRSAYDGPSSRIYLLAGVRNYRCMACARCSGYCRRVGPRTINLIEVLVLLVVAIMIFGLGLGYALALVVSSEVIE